MHMLSTTLLLQLNFVCCLVSTNFTESTRLRASPRRIIQAVGPWEGTNFGTKPKPVPFLRSHAGKKWQKNLRLRLSPPLLVFVTALHLLENCCFNKVQFHPTMTTFAFCGWKKPRLAQKKSQSWFNFCTLPHHLHGLIVQHENFLLSKSLQPTIIKYPHDDDDDDHLHVNSVACKWSKLWLGASKSGAWHLLLQSSSSSSSL